MVWSSPTITRISSSKESPKRSWTVHAKIQRRSEANMVETGGERSQESNDIQVLHVVRGDGSRSQLSLEEIAKNTLLWQDLVNRTMSN